MRKSRRDLCTAQTPTTTLPDDSMQPLLRDSGGKAVNMTCVRCGLSPRSGKDANDRWRRGRDEAGKFALFCAACWRDEFGVDVEPPYTIDSATARLLEGGFREEDGDAHLFDQQGRRFPAAWNTPSRRQAG